MHKNAFLAAACSTIALLTSMMLAADSIRTSSRGGQKARTSAAAPSSRSGPVIRSEEQSAWGSHSIVQAADEIVMPDDLSEELLPPVHLVEPTEISPELPTIQLTGATSVGPAARAITPALLIQAPSATTPSTQTPTDTTPPIPSTPIVEQRGIGRAILRIQFADNDLDAASVNKDKYRVYEEHNPSGGATYYTRVPVDSSVAIAGNTIVELTVNNLHPGVHWIVFDELEDTHGNKTPPASTTDNTFSPDTENSAIKRSFIVSSGSQSGEQVEYPRFLQPKAAKSEFVPGDRVDTKVVQLYYFRDARQVVEYINRNVRDLNQAAYDEAQQFSENARKQAEKSVDDRRYQETLAVEEARKTREIERQISETREKLDEANREKIRLDQEKINLEIAIQQMTGGSADNLEAAITALEGEIQTLTGQMATANAMTNPTLAQLTDTRRQSLTKLYSMKVLKRNLDTNAAAITSTATKISNLQGELGSGDDKLPARLMTQQGTEISNRNKLLQAEALELRAAQEQFRREVAAGLADRNSYAAGKMTSEDPVTQTSISVVGTSRIQLRGPIKGINKICRMIHQLDSPVGQVKLGIHTVQVNGEHGDRMDFVYERINQEIAHSRFLTNTSGMLLRKAVQEVASEVALQADQGVLLDPCPPEMADGVVTMLGDPSMSGTIQTTAEQRDRRYLYAFFGSDFIGELEEMDSELLNSENKLLSLHSMDTISLAGALFVTAHADNPIRTRIVQRFQELISGELPQRETEYVRALTHVNHHGKSLQNRFRTAMRIDNRNDAEIYFNANRTYHFPNTVTFFNEQVAGQGTLNPVQYSTVKLAQTLKAQLAAEIEYQNLVLERSLLESRNEEIESDAVAKLQALKAQAKVLESRQLTQSAQIIEILDSLAAKIRAVALSGQAADKDALLQTADRLSAPESEGDRIKIADAFFDSILETKATDLSAAVIDIKNALASQGVPVRNQGTLSNILKAQYTDLATAKVHAQQWLELRNQVKLAESQYQSALRVYESAKKLLFSKRLLEQFMDEQEEKSVDLMEALRSHSSNVDNYLKRLAIAVEDDVAAQFYEPAFQRIRRVSRTWDVTLGQVETTTVLTNNRTLAKVSPAATFEFDLPQRDILLTEALSGSKALATEYGNLLKDGTFLAGASMLSQSPASGIVGDNAPIQQISGMPENREFGSELQKLIPDPAVYKFETGTGFEIRPIIQPDGHSIVYGFDYMYSTNVREPVRADEKHLGRIKRHFVHTDVQTSSYELREISRYTVALKASRTDRGVPLLEDIPGVGAAFRPLPSQESSLQTNIILGSSTIYPTVYDLMGLRWSQHVDELGSTSLTNQKRQQTDRRGALREQLLRTTRDQVDQTIGLPPSREPVMNTIPPGFEIR